MTHQPLPTGSPVLDTGKDENRSRRRRLLVILFLLLLAPACLWVVSQIALLGLGMDEAHESLLSRLRATYAPWSGSSFGPLDPTMIGTIRAEQATFAAGGGQIGILVPYVPGGPGLTQIAALPSTTPTRRANPTATQPQPSTPTNVVVVLPETVTSGPPATVAPPPTAVGPTTEPPLPPTPPQKPTTSPPGSADLTISNDDGLAAYPLPGSVTYTITVTNTSPRQVNNARVTDILPPGQINVGAAAWTCLPTGAGSTCPPAGAGSLKNVAVSLGPNGRVTFTLLAPIAAGATGNLVTTATVTPPPAITDPNPANNSDTDVDTPALITTDLSIAKTDNRLSVLPGAPLTYTITVDNPGPAAVIGAVVSDPFVGVNTVTWTCTPTGGAACTAGTAAGDINDTVDMPAGSQLVYTVNTIVDALPATGSLVNTATVTAPAGIVDTNPANNAATDTDRIGKPDVVITLSWTSPDTLADLDLWVYDPGGLINAYPPLNSPSGGTLVSFDRQCSSVTPIFGLNEQEEVTWPTPLDIPPSGNYDIYAYDFRSCGAPFGTVTWTLTATVDGVVVGTRTGTITGQINNPMSFTPVQSVYCPGTQLFQGGPPLQARCNLPVPGTLPPPSDDPRALGDAPTLSFTIP